MALTLTPNETRSIDFSIEILDMGVYDLHSMLSLSYRPPSQTPTEPPIPLPLPRENAPMLHVHNSKPERWI